MMLVRVFLHSKGESASEGLEILMLGCEKFRILLGNVMVEAGYGMMKALNCKVRFCV